MLLPGCRLRHVVLRLLATTLPIAVMALPEYCTNPAIIPALPAGAVMQQVSVFIRHGDRTLATAAPCWPTDDVPYECDLGVIRGPSFTRDGSHVDPQLTYRMEYEPNREYLPGNCGVGQLTTRGYAQELNNGAALSEVRGRSKRNCPGWLVLTRPLADVTAGVCCDWISACNPH